MRQCSINLNAVRLCCLDCMMYVASNMLIGASENISSGK